MPGRCKSLLAKTYRAYTVSILFVSWSQLLELKGILTSNRSEPWHPPHLLACPTEGARLEWTSNLMIVTGHTRLPETSSPLLVWATYAPLANACPIMIHYSHNCAVRYFHVALPLAALRYSKTYSGVLHTSACGTQTCSTCTIAVSVALYKPPTDSETFRGFANHRLQRSRYYTPRSAARLSWRSSRPSDSNVVAARSTTQWVKCRSTAEAGPAEGPLSAHKPTVCKPEDAKHGIHWKQGAYTTPSKRSSRHERCDY